MEKEYQIKMLAHEGLEEIIEYLALEEFMPSNEVEELKKCSPMLASIERVIRDGMALTPPNQ